jgi:protease-4
MKNFLSSMLGALAALVIFCGATGVFFLLLLAGISALGEKKPTVESGSYLVVDLSTNITDSPPLVDFGALMGRKQPTLQLRTATQAIKAAGADGRIQGLLIVGSLQAAGYGSGLATLQELRAALTAFKASGKPVKAYLTYAGMRDYYVAATADEVILDPYGEVALPGLASEPMFLAGTFEKYGIGVQVTRVGKYKSAVEPFIRKDLSPENREQLQKLLDDLWTKMREDIAADRGMEPAGLQAVVDAEGYLLAGVAQRSGLVDRVEYLDEVIAKLKKETGVSDPTDTFRQIDLPAYARIAGTGGPVGGKSAAGKGRRGQIAVVYAEGDIVDGEGEPGQVGGANFARELRRLRQDDSVKAIVLRVNSPGGSASASEAIQREMRLAAEEKPVIVSMGSYAASGGYWIAAYSDHIFAEPTTITGSIGVFGVLFDVKKLANDFGVTFDGVKTGRFADTMTLSRPKTDAEMAMFQRSVDWIYDEFVGKVADARKLDRGLVEEIGQGRVWSGAEALELGLVDKLGGLQEAIAYAAEAAEIGDRYRVTEFPRKKKLGEAIAELLEGLQPVSARGGLVRQLTERLERELKIIGAFNDPRGIYARMPFELNLQ